MLGGSLCEVKNRRPPVDITHGTPLDLARPGWAGRFPHVEESMDEALRFPSRIGRWSVTLILLVSWR